MAYRINAIVEEKEEPLFVTTLSESEFEEQGDIGVEMLVRRWCENRGYTLIDFAI